MNNIHSFCPLCSSNKISPLTTNYSHAFLVKCHSCGLVFARKIPSREELQSHYKRYKRNNPISSITIKRYDELLRQFEPHRKLNRIFDIGCGDGHFLEAAKRQGWEVYGSEFTDDAITVCRDKNINMHQGLIQDFFSDPFDIITSFEVLEHIYDIREHLIKINSLLRKGGLFYFTTPNFNSFSRLFLRGKWNVIQYPDHLTYYTVGTISKLLINSHFSKKTLTTTGFSLQRFYVSSGNLKQNTISDENLRVILDTNMTLQFAKNALNGILNLFRLGDTIKGFFLNR
jgi:2-polyprenyl-3-methyl-5-hydroxy-6-metoxy-1,4-benzoquinol methylase